MAGTIQQIAEIAGVSRGTVDRALNERGRVNPEVSEKIWAIANEIGYVPKSRRLRTEKVLPGEIRKIGVITLLSETSFMKDVKHGIQDAQRELRDRGVELLVKESEGVDEEEQLKALAELESQGIEGLAIMPVESNRVRERLNELAAEKNIPVVTFNSDIIGTKRACYVGLDNRKSGRTAAGLMALMTKEKGKILVITGYFSNSVNSQRVDGFVEEMKKSFPQMELLGVQSSFDQSEEVEKIITNAMLSFPEINGIFVVSGGQAGVQRAFSNMKLERRPYVIIYDLTPVNRIALEEDVVDFLIDQNGYEQGYRPPFLLASKLLKGKEIKKEYRYTDITIRTKYNL
ncbi:MAG: LacI family DNA-binding transcriptional regulator [Eubacteriales bacterium]|nr:LacI family DNA-binding transcriptional regulator [Eubacteriales bacterium]